MVPLWMFATVVAIALLVAVLTGHQEQPGRCYSCNAALTPDDGELCLRCYCETYR